MPRLVGLTELLNWFVLSFDALPKGQGQAQW
jgi:hypothetical protein